MLLICWMTIALFLPKKAVGILDDTSKFDGFVYPGLGRNQCITDLKSVLKSIARDLQLGGNSNTWDAAREYLLDPADPNSDIKHIEGEVEEETYTVGNEVFQGYVYPCYS